MSRRWKTAVCVYSYIAAFPYVLAFDGELVVSFEYFRHLPCH
jgi:hypothetical protein